MIAENIRRIQEEIGNAVLVAVSKRKPIKDIKEAVDAGVKDIAENRIQEAKEKYNELNGFFKDNNVRFHFIGHLQTNKAKDAVMMFDLIQTLDSEKLAKEINKQAGKIGKVQEVLIQVNIGKEEQKTGIYPVVLDDFLRKVEGYPNLKIKGLMCIPPKDDPEKYFKMMKKMFDNTDLEILSMGMTSKYLQAIEEGSNMVRIGTAIFGERI